MLSKGTYFIETYGCEMNRYDSRLVETILQREGYAPAEDRDSSDYFFINTCSVRKHAENRVFALLSQYKALKILNPEMKIILLGCMAAKFRDDLLSEFSHLDYAIGPDGYRQIPKILTDDNEWRVYIAGDDAFEGYEDISPFPGEVTAGIAVMRGCNNFCSYCVVPYVRGRERSRSVDSIISEIEKLARSGVKEITLLGQNVNSYDFKEMDFPDLLREADKVREVERIRFLTSHPKDCSTKLLETMADCQKVAPHLHLPFQAGSDRILKLMNRKYTRRDYEKLIKRAKDIVNGISITTDIITGFPSETEDDFLQTIKLVEQFRFDDAFTYRYSVREGTKAAGMADDVPEEVKIERLGRLIASVRRIAQEKLKETVGNQYTVLIEQPSKKDKDWWRGRTEHNRVAVLPRESGKPGSMVAVRVEGVSGFTLKCQPINRI